MTWNACRKRYVQIMYTILLLIRWYSVLVPILPLHWISIVFIKIDMYEMFQFPDLILSYDWFYNLRQLDSLKFEENIAW